MSVTLSRAQKEEIRRLTQFANRRIIAVEQAYRRAGKDVLPRELVGDYQIKEKWHTSKTPISRSVKFDSLQDYRRQLKKLRSFEFEKDDIWTYTRVQREKVLQAVETSLGVTAPPDLQNKILSLSAPQVTDFWKKYSERSIKMLSSFSSNAAMAETAYELFPEDLTGLSSSLTK